jgi:hypothetical protein
LLEKIEVSESIPMPKSLAKEIA